MGRVSGLWHVPIKESQQQFRNGVAIGIGIRQQEDALVTKFRHVELWPDPDKSSNLIRRAKKRMHQSKDYFQAIDEIEYNLSLKTENQV